MMNAQRISIHLCNCSCSHRTPSSAPFQSLTTNWSETTGEDPFLLLLLQSHLKIIIIIIINEKLNTITDMQFNPDPPCHAQIISVFQKKFHNVEQWSFKEMHVLCSIYKPNSDECKASDLFHFDCWLKYKVEFKTPLEVCLHTHTCITTCGSPWTKEKTDVSGVNHQKQTV